MGNRIILAPEAEQDLDEAGGILRATQEARRRVVEAIMYMAGDPQYLKFEEDLWIQFEPCSKILGMFNGNSALPLEDPGSH